MWSKRILRLVILETLIATVIFLSAVTYDKVIDLHIDDIQEKYNCNKIEGTVLYVNDDYLRISTGFLSMTQFIDLEIDDVETLKQDDYVTIFYDKIDGEMIVHEIFISSSGQSPDILILYAIIIDYCMIYIVVFTVVMGIVAKVLEVLKQKKIRGYNSETK